MCGEKIKQKFDNDVDKGSPPRMRGKGARRHAVQTQIGITPAHAGKSISVPSIQSGAGDHPRACGEKMLTGDTTDEETGSPPRMRGKAAVPLSPMVAYRITPAHAGKSMCHRTRCAGPWDHPRACGEKREVKACGLLLRGSPPRMRGKVASQSSWVYSVRITPACAGKRRAPPLPASGLRDHPRVCGEKILWCAIHHSH